MDPSTKISEKSLGGYRATYLFLTIIFVLLLVAKIAIELHSRRGESLPNPYPERTHYGRPFVNQPNESNWSEVPMVEVSTIAQAYRQSYQFSQESYEDGFVRVIGIVGEIHIEEATSVVLMSSDGRYAVNCKLSEDAKECVSAIAVGKRISIIGRCRGLENSKVVFDESLILGNEAGGS